MLSDISEFDSEGLHFAEVGATHGSLTILFAHIVSPVHTQRGVDVKRDPGPGHGTRKYPGPVYTRDPGLTKHKSSHGRGMGFESTRRAVASWPRLIQNGLGRPAQGPHG